MDADATADQQSTVYLIIYNIAKQANIRALLCSAAAFGCHVLVVGQPQLSVPNVVADYYQTKLRRFAKWKDCVLFVQQYQIRLLGIEIHEDAKPIEAYCLTDRNDKTAPSTAFLVGNEGQGLSSQQLSCCDGFVRIPQYGCGTASLNVYVAASIVLQRYHDWQRQLLPLNSDSHAVGL